MDRLSISTISSEPYRIIGPQGMVCYVHSDLLSLTSKIFATEVEGSMQEARKKAIEIEAVDGDIDDETIMRFVQYVYTGDYTTPPTGRVGEHYRNEAQEAEDGLSKRSIGKEPPKKRQRMTDSDEEDGPLRMNCPRRRLHARHKFCSGVPHPVWMPWDTDINARALDYTENLLCHARLYVFSNRYSCDELKSLCVKKLHMNLVNFDEYSGKWMQSVTQLIRYVFEHTQEFKTGYDSLRKLVIDYAVFRIDELLKEAMFLKMLVDQGSLAKDLIIHLA